MFAMRGVSPDLRAWGEGRPLGRHLCYRSFGMQEQAASVYGSTQLSGPQDSDVDGRATCDSGSL